MRVWCCRDPVQEVEKKRVGRRNIYNVNESALFSFPVYQGLNIAQMITALRRILEEQKTAARSG